MSELVPDSRSYQISVKALVLLDGKALLLHERDGTWDLPGGRMEHGEDFHTTLHRECREEMGVGCMPLDQHPFLAWTVPDHHGNWRVVLCFRVKLDSMEFTPSDECDGHGFFGKEEMETMDVYPTAVPLKDFL